MDRLPKVTVRLDKDGALVEVDVDAHAQPTELVEERDPEPMPSFGDYSIKRNWLLGGE